MDLHLAEHGVSGLPTSTLTMLLFFGTNACVYLAVSVLDAIKPANRYSGYDLPMEQKGTEVVNPKQKKMISFVTLSKPSLMALSKEVFHLGLIMLYVWVCENKPFFYQDSKTHDLDFFFFLSIGVVVLGFGTIHDDGVPLDILNRDQTEEWKGWMQVMFLLYHYFHVNEVYNAIRVMISCYVWMTGFGNVSFFYIRRDFTFVRAFQMIWRINFLVFFLAMTMNNMYILYYICPLHTFYFLVTYITMAIRNNVNHSRFGLRVKMMIAGIVIWLIWEIPQVFNIVFYWIPNEPHPGAAVGAYGVRYEWHFRSGLDHYSTFYGMLFALNFPQAKLWLEQVEKMGWKQQFLAKGGTALVLILATVWWTTQVFVLPKLEYNAVHPYAFIIPLTCYIFLRNCHPILRQNHLSFLASIGKVTLETYLMQHHIWLTSNAKTLLVLVPHYPKVNMVVVTTVYVLIAKRLFRLTIATRAMCIPSDNLGAFKSLATLSFVFGAFGCLAWTLQVVGAGFVVLAAVVTLLSIGVVIGAKKLMLSPENVHLILCKPFYLFAFIVAMLSLVLPAYAPASDLEINGGPIRMAPLHLSPTQCAMRVNEGSWQPAMCPHGHENSLQCTSDIWEWNATVAKSCGFKKVGAKKFVKMLKGRTLAVVGDQQAFRTFVALEKLVDPNAGYKTSLKADVQFDAGQGAYVSFRYAETMEEVEKRVVKEPADVIVFGAFLKDIQQQLSPAMFARAVRRIHKQNPDKVLIWLQPTSVADGPKRATLKAYIDNVEADDKIEVIAVEAFQQTLNRLEDTVDGVQFSFHTHELFAQLALNAAEKKLDVKTAKSRKGGVGGISHSPLLGGLTLLVAGVMVVTMDNYFGISFFFKGVALGDEKITWAESVRTLHSSIGVSSVGDRQVELAEKDKSSDSEKD